MKAVVEAEVEAEMEAEVEVKVNVEVKAEAPEVGAPGAVIKSLYGQSKKSGSGSIRTAHKEDLWAEW